jgi:hypothetical protein
MVAYSFKRRFVEPMLWGRKDGTIRLPRDGASRHCGEFREMRASYFPNGTALPASTLLQISRLRQSDLTGGGRGDCGDPTALSDATKPVASGSD